MKNRGKFGEFEELGVRKSGAFFRRKSTELSSQNSALSSKGKVILLIACLFLLLFPLASAKDFIIRNESDSSDLYFVVNGTTGNVDVPSTGFFGWLGSLADSITKLWAVEINATANISTPMICLDGDCQTGWPSVTGEGGWNDTGSVIELVTSSDNVSGGSLFVDNTNSRVGIGTSTPSSLLEISKINGGGDVRIGI